MLNASRRTSRKIYVKPDGQRPPAYLFRVIQQQRPNPPRQNMITSMIINQTQLLPPKKPFSQPKLDSSLYDMTRRAQFILFGTSGIVTRAGWCQALIAEAEAPEAEDDDKDDDEPYAVAAAKEFAHNLYLLKLWPLKAHSIVFRRGPDVTALLFSGRS
jgi:hypothetical protein